MQNNKEHIWKMPSPTSLFVILSAQGQITFTPLTMQNARTVVRV